MGRRPRPQPPETVLQFTGISEEQWKFLRVRAYEESDARAAEAIGLTSRVVEGWKKRSEHFRALYSLALTQPRLFASAELRWRSWYEEPQPPRHDDPARDAGLAVAGRLYVRQEQDAAFTRELRRLERAATEPTHPPPLVDLAVPEQYKRVNDPPREMRDSERVLAQALGVEHAVVEGYWNGRPSFRERPRHEAAVDIVAQYTPGFRIDHWYPDGVLFTSAGVVAFADGSLGGVVGCPVKRKRRCPYIGDRVHIHGSCSLWDLALTAWLDHEPPSERTRSPLCDRDFSIARLLAYVSAATMRGHNEHGGWYAGFPVITVKNAVERTYWEPRVAHWNKLILDPWHRLRLIDLETIIRAAADFVATEKQANHSSWPEDRR